MGETKKPDAHIVMRNNMTLGQNRKHIMELPKETNMGVPIGQEETTKATPKDIQPTGRSRFGEC